MGFAERALEDPSAPLGDVCFCVVDLETTGGSPRACAITEIGALRVRRGEVLGRFHSLVDPGEPVPAFVRLLTGITDRMLTAAPSIEAVLPSFLEFLGGSVFVAHNARFDLAFLDAALHASGYPTLPNQVVDTALLARKMLAGEVPNHRLHTLTHYLRCAHRPSHRAYADVLAATDVLHHLIERATGFGVTTLEDLLTLSSARMDGTFAKINLCDELPRGPGVYRFLGPYGKTLYVGKASDVRSRVRSYFYGDPRRRIRDLLKETQSIVAEPHGSTLEAEVAEVRAIAAELPPYNRAGKARGAWYLKIDRRARVPRLGPVRVPKEDQAVYLGPLSSLKGVRALLDSFRDALHVHRCSDPGRCEGCAFGEMGTCPGDRPDRHRAVIDLIAHAVDHDPEMIFIPLYKRMRALAAFQRFEEASEVRTRAALLRRTLDIRAETRSLLDAGTITITDGARAWLVSNGLLIAGADAGNAPSLSRRIDCEVPPIGSFWPPDRYREARVISSWIRRNVASLVIVHVSGTWAMPLGFRPGIAFNATKVTA